MKMQRGKNRSYDLSMRSEREIISMAHKHHLERVILFGSRARGTSTPRSDIDIAVSGGNFDSFYWDIKENFHSLLMFDIINIDEGISEELEEELKRDGVILYEKNK